MSQFEVHRMEKPRLTAQNYRVRAAELRRIARLVKNKSVDDALGRQARELEVCAEQLELSARPGTP
jgi:hypothetical protein